jgi:hypothetical protein
MDGPAELLFGWLGRQLPEPQRSWLEEQRRKLASGAADRDLYLAISLVPRRLGKHDLALEPADLAAAETARPGWDPRGWSVDQAGRVALLLTGGGAGEGFARRLEQLFATADIVELIAFYQGLPLYPDPERHVMRAREGARSGMRPVFEAVAHRNPYPAERFDDNAWNHMVLKALFIGSTLAPIQALDRRTNPELMRMLCDYAHERWAAGRPVTPELWRCVGPFADEAALDDLARVLATGGPAERRAAALALSACPAPRARALLAREPELVAEIRAGAVRWDDPADGA